MDNLESDRDEFPVESLERLRQRVRHARAMLRSVMVAINAQDDGAINFDSQDGDAHRWHPLIGAVCNELREVRELFIEGLNTPVADWMKPLAQAEALDAAVWYGLSCQVSDRLGNEEIVDAAEAIIDSLDDLLEQACSVAIPRVGQVAAAVAH